MTELYSVKFIFDSYIPTLFRRSDMREEIIVGLVTAALLGIVAILRNRYFTTRPKLTVKYDFEGSSRDGRDLSNKNDWSKPIAIPYVQRVFKYKWQYIITLRNITEYKAYDIEILYFDDFKWNKTDGIDNSKALSEDEEVQLRNELHYSEEGIAREVRNSDSPESIRQIKFVVKYKNKYGISFYTIYDAEAKSFQYLIRRPKGV